jgi:hypothetical protein
MTRDVPKLLALAEERVARVNIFLHTQRDFIKTLRHIGRDTTAAEVQLREWEDLQVRFIADRDKLRQELAQAT